MDFLCEPGGVDSKLRVAMFTKSLIRIALLVCVAALSAGCATPYMIDRGRDAADIFAAGIGLGVGLKGRVGPVQAGFLFDVPFVGLRGGEIVDMTPGSCMAQSIDVCLLFAGTEDFVDCSADRGKQFRAGNIENGGCAGIPFLMMLDETTRAPYYYTHIEFVIGCMGSMRLGFNPGELLDFILGWTTIDIFRDDLEAKKRRLKVDHPGTKVHGKVHVERDATGKVKRLTLTPNDGRAVEVILDAKGSALERMAGKRVVVFGALESGSLRVESWFMRQ